MAKENGAPQLEEGQVINQRITHIAIADAKAVTYWRGKVFELHYEDFGELVEELNRQSVSVFRTYDSFFGETLYKGKLITVQSTEKLDVSRNYFIDGQTYSLEQVEDEREKLKETLQKYYKPVNVYTGMVESMERAIEEFKKPDEADWPKKLSLVGAQRGWDWFVLREGDTIVYTKKWQRDHAQQEASQVVS